MEFDHVQEIMYEVLLVPIIGHTQGYCGVAIKTAEGRLLHCGDVYIDRRQIETGSKVPMGARMHRRVAIVDPKANERWLGLLRELQHCHRVRN